MDRSWSTLGCWKGSLPMAGGWNGMVYKVPSHPNRAVILWWGARIGQLMLGCSRWGAHVGVLTLGCSWARGSFRPGRSWKVVRRLCWREGLLPGSCTHPHATHAPRTAAGLCTPHPTGPPQPCAVKSGGATPHHAAFPEPPLPSVRTNRLGVLLCQLPVLTEPACRAEPPS